MSRKPDLRTLMPPSNKCNNMPSIVSTNNCTFLFTSYFLFGLCFCWAWSNYIVYFNATPKCEDFDQMLVSLSHCVWLCVENVFDKSLLFIQHYYRYMSPKGNYGQMFYDRHRIAFHLLFSHALSIILWSSLSYFVSESEDKSLPDCPNTQHSGCTHSAWTRHGWIPFNTFVFLWNRYNSWPNTNTLI